MEKHKPFNERFGPKKDIPLQLKSINTKLRNSIFNNLNVYVNLPLAETHHPISRIVGRILFEVWINLFGEKANSKVTTTKIWDTIEYKIEHSEWYDIYAIIEFIVIKFDEYQLGSEAIKESFNELFEKHNSAYRFIDNYIVPITTEQEISEIQEALNMAEQNNYIGMKRHLSEALEFISFKPEPKPASSIKASIDAVEWITRKMSGCNTLGDAVNKMKNNKIVPPEILSAIEKLYSYTNSKEGIRHPQIVDESIVSFDEAKLYLVICSALCHYLQSIAAKNSITLQ
jgi:hypothetical protein